MKNLLLLLLTVFLLQAEPKSEQPRVAHVESPHYPAIARTAGVQGEVMISAEVDSGGKVRHVEANGTRSLLKDAAVENIGKWNFEPRFSGSFQFTVFYDFSLREKENASADEDVSFNFDLPHQVRIVANPPHRESNGSSEVRVIHHDPIHYPPLARQTRIGGDVKLFVVLDAAGKIVELDVESGHPLLRAGAVENVRTWKFESPPSGPTAFQVTYEFSTLYDKDAFEVNVTFDLPHHVRIQAPTPMINPDQSRGKNYVWWRCNLWSERQREERFLSTQADLFAGAKREEKVGLLRSKCRVGEGRGGERRWRDPSASSGQVNSPLQAKEKMAR